MQFFWMVLVVIVACVNCQIRFEDHFAHCKRTDPRFDNCLKEALNSVRPYFRTGLPQYGVRPFDPFHANEVVQMRGGSNFNYKLTLRNVTESGWTNSQIMRLRSDFDNYQLQFTHYFPDKRLTGDYEFEGEVYGRKFRTGGSWNLKLNDYTQSMTLSKRPRMNMFGEMMFDTPIACNVTVMFCRHLELHASNLLGGRSLLENMADRVINSAWVPGFFVLRPLIGDMVGTAFTKIFTDNFQDFPFEQLIR